MTSSTKQRIDTLTNICIEAREKGEHKVSVGVGQLQIILNMYIANYEANGHVLDATNSVSKLRADNRFMKSAVERLEKEKEMAEKSLNSLTAEKSRWVRRARKAGIKI